MEMHNSTGTISPCSCNGSPHSHVHSHSHPHSNSNTHSHPNSVPHPHSNPHGHPQSNSNSPIQSSGSSTAAYSLSIHSPTQEFLLPSELDHITNNLSISPDESSIEMSNHTNIILNQDQEMQIDESDNDEENDSDDIISIQSSLHSNNISVPEIDQHDLRAQIQRIQQNDAIPSLEKAKKIQELMTRKWKAKQPQVLDKKIWNLLENKSRSNEILVENDCQPTYSVRKRSFH